MKSLWPGNTLTMPQMGLFKSGPANLQKNGTGTPGSGTQLLNIKETNFIITKL
jgi:hypothetical protein